MMDIFLDIHLNAIIRMTKLACLKYESSYNVLFQGQKHRIYCMVNYANAVLLIIIK